MSELISAFIWVSMSLLVLGSLLTLHLDKRQNYFYSPWIGLFILINITTVLSLSKIPLEKQIFGITFLKGTNFVILITLFLALISLLNLNLKKINFKSIYKYEHLYLTLSILFIVYFSSQFGDVDLVQRANDLKTLSLAEEILLKKQVIADRFQIGIPLLISFFSTILNMSSVIISRVVYSLVILLNAGIVAGLIAKKYKYTTKVEFALLFLFVVLQIASIQFWTLNNAFVVGVTIFIYSLTMDYLDKISNRETETYLEEVILALALLSTLLVSVPIFKFVLLTFILVLTFRSLRNRRLWRWLKVLLFAFIFNPLLIGFLWKVL